MNRDSMLSARSGDAAPQGLVLRRPTPDGALSRRRSVPPIVHEVLRSPGQSLDAETRGAMESRFGHDFSHIRVHSDGKAAESAQAVSALAYTVGQDVVFASGRYAPHTPDGERLLAHEMVHAIQQSSIGAATPDTFAVGEPDTAYEREANQLAQASTGAPALHAEPVMQRQAPVPPAVPIAGVAIAAASFASTTRSADTGGLTETDVEFRYARSRNRALPIREDRRTVFHMDSVKGLGGSFGFWDLVLRYDGENIISAYTEQDQIEGYDGGTFGSSATMNFRAIEASAPDARVTEAYLLFNGVNNPLGPGFHRFAGRLRVNGDGEVIPEQCRLTDGDGYARVNPFWCEVGFD